MTRLSAARSGAQLKQRRFCAIAFAATLAIAAAPAPSGAADGPLLLMEHGRLRRAAALAESRIQSGADSLEALRVLAMVRAEQKRFDEATKLAEQAVAVAPGDPDAHYTLAQVAGMHAEFASVLKQPGLAKRFKREAEKALALDPNHQDAIEGLAEFYHRAPSLMGGDKKKSAAFADRLVELNATSGYLEKSTIAFDDKDTTQAVAWLRKAVGANGQPRAKVALAGWLIQPWRNPDEAERLAREAAESESWRVSAWALLAVGQAHQKRWAELDATLASAEAGTGGNLSPHYQAGRMMITDKSDPSRAEALFRRYLTVEPEIGQPSLAGAHWRLGQALEQLGRKSDAIAEMQIALKLDPKLEGAKQDLKRLKG